MLELDEIKKLHDKAYVSGQVTRERAADDLVFYWVTQWDDNALDESQLAYRGEFDILRKAGRAILADLSQNPVQVDFEPVDSDEEDGADLADGLYRKGLSNNLSIEAFSNAEQEAVVCGYGAWVLYTEYKTNRVGDNLQVIRRRPIFEANNTLFFDPNAKLLDKSDSDYCSIIWSYSEDGYRQLVNDLTDEELETINYSSFKSPEQSYTFPWTGGHSKKIYIGEFYHREKVKDKVLNLTDPFGQDKILLESDLSEVMDEMIDAGFNIVGEKVIERWEITRYICSGAEILDTVTIAGQNIPVVPSYGEHAYVEGEEHYEGVTRLAKDPQRLRNFQLSYLADIVSQSPRQQPIFLPEQVAGHEDMYSLSGIDNNFPYLLQNRKSLDGTDLPIGPVAVMPEQPIPSALIASIQLSREAVEDVANPGTPQNIADPDLSGKAVLALQASLDKQSMIYQIHRKHALRRDGEIWVSMAAAVMDVPRTERMELPDGTSKTIQIMEQIVDTETGDVVTLNDLTDTEFEVTSKISASYSSMKEQTLQRLEMMVQGLPPGDPMRDFLILKALVLMDGVDFDDVRDYANKQLVLKGYRDPETDEEKEMMAQAQQQGDQPSAEMLLGMAEMKKAQVAEGELQLRASKIQLDGEVAQLKGQIETFKAQTDRMDTQIDAQEAKATIDNKNIDSFGKQIDNQAKMIQLQKPADMSDDELLKALSAT